MEISDKQLRIGFRLGIYDFNDVQSWVNLKIIQSNKPSEQVLELSFTKKEQSHEIYSLLSSIPNTEEDDESLMKVLGDIEEKDLNNIEYCRNLSGVLYSYYVDRDYTVNDKLGEIGFFDDGYSLALQGIGDSIETWHSRFKEFINQFKSC